MPPKPHPNVKRRDDMWTLFERYTLDNDIKEKVTALLKSISKDDFQKPPNHSNLTNYPIWETICVAAYLSHLAGWGMPKVRRPQNYLPTFNDTEFEQFILSWEDVRKRPDTSVDDLLDLLRPRPNFKTMIRTQDD